MNSAVIGNLKAILSLDTTNFDKGVTNSEANAKKLADRLSKDLAPSQQRINSLIRDFAGSTDIRRALEYATAIEKVGGATKLTASEQAKTNRVVQEAIDKYRALGQTAPKHLLELANATKQAAAPTLQLADRFKSLVAAFSIGSLIDRGVAAVGQQIGVLASQGMKLEGLRRGYEQLAVGVKVDSGQMLTALQEGTRGMVANIDLFQTANKAMLLGLPVTVSSMGDMAKAATSLGKAMGLDATTALDNLITALGRTSPLILDNLGLSVKVEEANEKYARSLGKTVEQLTDVEKKMAFYNAAMEAARQKTAELGEQTLTLSDQFEVLWTGIKNGATSSLSWLNTTLGVGIQRLIDDALFLGSVINKAQFGPQMSLEEKEAAREWAKAMAGAPNIKSPLAMPGSAGLPDIKQAMAYGETLKKATDKAADAAKAYRSRIDELKQSMLGLSKAQREQLQAEQELAHEGHVDVIAALLPMRDVTKDLVKDNGMLTASVVAVGEAYITAAARAKEGFFQMGRIFDAKAIFGNAMSVPDLLKGVNVPGDRFGKSLEGMFAMLPQTILASFQGGGNPLKSIASMFGSGILGAPSILGTMKDGVFGGGLGKSLQGIFGKTFGGVVANIIPGIGALLGPALGKLFGAIGNIGSNSTKKSREEFAKQAGFENLDNLYAKLKSLGAEGEKLANIGLNVIGKKDKAANEKWMKDVTAFFDRLEKVPGKVAELSSALGKFGGAIPKQLEPLLDSILGNSNLSADMRKQLEGMRKPSWQAAQELAASFGVDPGALGAGFNQSRIADSAFSIKRAADLFGSFAGSDSDAIIRGLADELSQVAEEAKKNNVALPKEVQNLVRRADELNLLIDSNGERIDSALLTFADIEDEYQKQVVGLLEQIRDLLGGKAAGGSAAVGDSGGASFGGTPRLWNNYDVGAEMAMPGFAGGTHGQFMDFGAGTPVMLHGKERVMTAHEDSSAVPPMMTVIYQADGRELSRTVMPYVAGEVRRLGLAKA